MTPVNKGTLFVVATPIGNLEDFSPRALRILREVKLIYCEDTRVTAKLKAAFGISTPLRSCFEQNEMARIPEIIAALEQGDNLALVSDAGTPLVSDPGFRVVRACREMNFPVISVPGPCSAIAALSISGLACDRFLFGGFLPVKKGKRESAFKEALANNITSIWFESAHRIISSLEMISSISSAAPIFVCREVTKQFEESFYGNAESVISDLLARPSAQRGEFVLIVGRVKCRSAVRTGHDGDLEDQDAGND